MDDEEDNVISFDTKNAPSLAQEKIRKIWGSGCYTGAKQEREEWEKSLPTHVAIATTYTLGQLDKKRQKRINEFIEKLIDSGPDPDYEKMEEIFRLGSNIIYSLYIELYELLRNNKTT